MALSSSRATTLYRLTGAKNLKAYLSDPGIDVECTDEPFVSQGLSCFLRYGYSASPRPSWQTHVESLIGHPVLLPGTSPFAVLLVQKPPWAYALTWGDGYVMLEDEYVEQGFGLGFAMHRLDEFQMGSITSQALDTSSRVAQISFPRGAPFGSFGIRAHGELVSRLRGLADLAGLESARGSAVARRTIKAADSLQIPLAQDFTALISDIDVIAGVADLSEPDNALRAVAQVRPLRRGSRTIVELDRRLSVALNEPETMQIDIAWPADSAVDMSEALSFRITSLGTGGPIHIEAPIQLVDITERLRRIPVTRRAEALKLGHIQAYSDEEGTERVGGGSTAKKWVSFETVIDSVRYVLRNGSWYRIGEAYAQQIADEVGSILGNKATLNFPRWVPTGKSDDENRYCKLAAPSVGGISIDRRFAKTPRHAKVELCDIFGPKDELIHVKWLGTAPAFSHLISQAEASMSALQNEPDALTWLSEEVRKQSVQKRTVRGVPDNIVLAGAGRQWNVKELFAMSQISLLRFIHGLPRNISVTFADIPYMPKSSR